MDFKGRINQLALALGINKTTLQEQVGLSNSYFANVNRVSGKVSAKIKQLYPQVNIEWLNEGVGTMFLDQENPVSNYTVPLLPTSAAAGSLSMFENQINGYECEKIISPIKGVGLAMTVSGESMTPEYPNGCKVLMKKINEAMFIEWGKTYVLDTRNGAVIKNVFPSKNEENIICRSINPNYPDFEINKEDITSWYRVVMQLSMK